MNPWISLQHATRALGLAAETRDVYLFGSTAAQLCEFIDDHTNSPGQMPNPDHLYFLGRDFDLVVTVSEEVYLAWNKMLLERLQECQVDCDTEQDAYHGCKWIRFNLALELLGCGTHHDLMPLYGWLVSLDAHMQLDLHLMPANWRQRVIELQDHLPHKDPAFVSNIARDAILLTETSTAHITTWQSALIKQISRRQRIVESIRRGFIFSAAISAGLTAETTE